MDPNTNRGCPHHRTLQALEGPPCWPALNSSTDQDSRHYNEPGADRTLAPTLNTPCTPSQCHEHPLATSPHLPYLLSSPSGPSSSNNITICSPASSEGQTQQFTKVPVVAEYIETSSHAASRADSECGMQQIDGHQNKTNLELETREFLRSYGLRDGDRDDPYQDSRLTAAGESHAGPSNAEYPPRRPPGNNRREASESDRMDSRTLETEGRGRTETFVIIDIHDNTIVADLTLPVSSVSSRCTTTSSGSTARTKVFAAYHPIFNTSPWEAVASETPDSTTQLQEALETFGTGSSRQSPSTDVSEQMTRSEDGPRPSVDEATLLQRRRCRIIGLWRALREPRPRSNVPPATEELRESDTADGAQEQQQHHSRAAQGQSDGSIAQAIGLDQEEEGLPSEQQGSSIAQEQASAVELNTTVSPGAAEDTPDVLSEAIEAQAATRDQSTVDANNRKGWKAKIASIFLCGADVPAIEPRPPGVPPPPLSIVDGSRHRDGRGQNELCLNPAPTVSASCSDPHTGSVSMMATLADPAEDSSSTFTSSSSRIIFGRILLGLEEMLTMLSQLVKPDSRPRDTSAA